MKRILITGIAGFIGSALTERLVRHEDNLIIGLDSINDYYDPKLKMERLDNLGISSDEELKWGKEMKSRIYPKLSFIRLNLEDEAGLEKLLHVGKFDYVIHLAAQTGIRHSIDHPREYLKSNVDGFLNILEGCKNNKIKHLIYASSSSVYGLNGKSPSSEHDPVDHPVSLYAATKKSNELMAHVYSNMYGLPITGLRFFTVYGPWGRPDMFPMLSMDAIINNKPIKVYNNGEMFRDFTYIDDIVDGITGVIDKIPMGKKDWDCEFPDPASSLAPYRIYNIGNSLPIKILDFLETIEKVLGKKADKKFMPMQPGDMLQTFADISDIRELTGFQPSTDLLEGIKKTVSWYKSWVLKNQ